MDAYPSLSLTLSGTELHMGPRDYLLLGSPLATSAGQFCLGNLRASRTVPCVGTLYPDPQPHPDTDTYPKSTTL